MKTRDFLLTLGTVIIGIVVTFGGNSLIQRRAERRSTAHILSMVKEELQHNISQIEKQKEILQHEYSGVIAFEAYIENPRLMPIDTLEKYYDILISTQGSIFSASSFDVLKSSSQDNIIKNKELLLGIFDVYSEIDTFYQNVDNNYYVKSEFLDNFYSNIDSKLLKGVYNDEGSVMSFFAEIMTNKPVTAFIVRNANGNGFPYLIPRADELTDKIEQVIAAIDKEIE